MKKVLIATFDNGEEAVFHDLLNSLEEKQTIELADNFLADTLLRYGDIEIRLKYPGQVFSKKQIYEQVWTSLLGCGKQCGKSDS